MTVPPLTLRKDQSDPLTAVQHDRNLVTIRDSINGLSALLGVAIKEDGSLQDDAVNRTSILLDRVVGRDKLGWLANHFGIATLKPGSGKEYVCTITPNPQVGSDPCNPAQDLKFPDTPGKDGTGGDAAAFVAPILFQGENTEGGVSIAINGAQAKDIVKEVDRPLDAGDIADGLILWIAYDPVHKKYQAVSPLSSASRYVETTWLDIDSNPDIVADGGGHEIDCAGTSLELAHTKGDDLPSSVMVFMKPETKQNGFETSDIVDGFRLMYSANGAYQQPGIALSYATNKVKLTFTAVEVTKGDHFFYMRNEKGIDSTLPTTTVSRFDRTEWKVKITATWT